MYKRQVLYVPVTQLDLLSRYTAPGDEEKVKLAKLGGTEWQRTRAKVKKATEETVSYTHLGVAFSATITLYSSLCCFLSK